MTGVSAFSTHLRALRQAAGMTMEQLAEASGVSARAISDMERGHSRAAQARTLAALADGLGLDRRQRGELTGIAQQSRSSTGAGRPRLCEMPRAIGDFVGRTAELELAVASAGSRADGASAPVVVVHGQAGLGKTAFAVRLADELAERFPDGRFYLDLRGTDASPMPAGEALVRLLRACEVSPRRIAETDAERSSQLRAVLRERRCLLVLDNAANEAQIRPLLPGDGPGMAVVTSRRLLGGLDDVARIALEPLVPDESARLLRGIAAQAVDPGAAGAVASVADFCGHLPLALRIAGTRLATRPAWTVDHLVSRLADADRRLAVLTSGDTGVATAFALSHAQLPEDAATLFRRLAHVPGVDFAAPIAAVLTGTGLPEAVDGLELLVELGLLQPEGADRYRFHDLIRLYAAERLRIEEPPGTRAETARRMRDWLLDTAIVAGRWFEPGYGSLPDGWAGLVPLATADEAAAWLQAESENWLEALRGAANAGADQLVVDVAESMHWFSDRMTFWAGWYEVYGLSRAAAARLPDRRQEVTHLNYLSWAATHAARRPPEGAEIAMAAHRLAVEIGDRRQQGWALQYAAAAWRFTRVHHGQALDACRRALRLFDETGDHDAYVQQFQGIGLLLMEQDRLDEAVEQFRATIREVAVRPVASAPGKGALAGAHTFMAEALVRAGRWAEALEAAQMALTLVRDFASTTMAGQVHLTLARARIGLGVPAEARDDLLLALRMLDEDMPRHIDLARAELAALDGSA
ncbi:ATP-binding protein [Actinoplanes sp. G11-F43]|uniref:ATP-binding protein n=1 Tax=Actinoplanes sp. G11-F43 TaxID=3424130 RepID=UPI003D358049